MFLPGMRLGPRKTNRNKCARKNAANRAKNRRRRNGLKK